MENFGAKSKTALEKVNNLPTAQRYCQNRIDYRYQRVKANPSQEVFLAGWLRRDRDLLLYVNELGGLTTPKPTPKPVSQTEILSKVEQAIQLLQEAVDLLKKQ